MKYLNLLSIVLLSAVLCGCGGNRISSLQVKEYLSEAEAALKAGRYDVAIDLCNEIIESQNRASLSWRDYSRAAAIYAVAYDHDVDPQRSMASASRCLSQAIKIQPDSVNSFINSQSPEFAGALNTVIRTIDGLNTDRSTIGDHEEDGMDMLPEGEHAHQHVEPDSTLNH